MVRWIGVMGVVLTLPLAGCGGSDGAASANPDGSDTPLGAEPTDDTADQPGLQRLSFAEMEAQAILLQASAFSNAVTGPDMPVSGSATYRGLAGIETPQDRLAGQMELFVSFEGDNASVPPVDRITGTIGNWAGIASGELTGIVTLTRGAFVGDTIFMSATGTLGAGITATQLTLEMEGRFRGAEAALMAGTVSGTIAPAGQSPVGITDGAFGAERE